MIFSWEILVRKLTVYKTTERISVEGIRHDERTQFKDCNKGRQCNKGGGEATQRGESIQ